MSAALLVALCLLPLHAQSKWTHATGDHFEVYTTGGDAVARRALEEFDRVHSYFEQVLQIPALTGPRTRLIVFNSRDEFTPYAANTSVKAFYQSCLDGDFIVLPSLRGDVFPAIAHEYAHLVFRRTGHHYPLWLDDGLAEYFSSVSPQGARLQIGAAVPERAKTLGFGVRLLPLERLFAVSRDSAEYTTPARASLFYAESWALTHMLLTDDRYRGKSAALLARLAKGEPTALALTTIYGKPVDEISRDLTKYALRGYYRASTIDVALPPLTANAVMQPATDFEAGVTLGSLLAANPDHATDAQQTFRSLEQQNANDLYLIESMAMFFVRARRFEDARPYLERAIALNTSSARIFSHFAEVRQAALIDKASGDDEQDVLFDKALSLSPDDVEVKIQIARAYVERRRGADAMAMLESVSRVPIEYERVFADTRAAALKVIRAPVR